MVSQVELRRLRSFVETTRLGSFAAAAKTLGYTAPAVSQHVALLERELGCELLVRGARGVKTTPAGAILQERAERLLADAQLAELAVKEATGQLRALRVGAFPSAAQHLVPDALASLRSRHPNAELTLLHFEPPDGLGQLATGHLDAVITHRYPGVTWAAPTGVRVQPLGPDPLDLMVPAEHPLAGRRRADIEQLRDEVFISGTAKDANRVALETLCARARFAPTIAFETIDYAVTATLVTKGFGIALVPRLAWPREPPVAGISIHAAGHAIARHIALAHRTAEHSPLVFELFHHLQRDRRPRPRSRAKQ